MTKGKGIDRPGQPLRDTRLRGVPVKTVPKILVKMTITFWQPLVSYSLHIFRFVLNHSLIEKDHLGDWSPEKDCC